ncbi:hypothetical protein AB685_08790 [Bacillus sp. LL01]|uniref:hypothetical protein n=1 Tax=Bacillus sp. LL01 TaxID=1665556 RepID=UPI00064D33E6|nr:hypothetical protein [Bacillus sp. LL01]KMJ59145.1 hypothetical protein AB685_08790 [Bacillus sp. LL01]
MLASKKTYQLLIALVGILFFIYNFTLKANVSSDIDTYIIFPVTLVLLGFFAFLYVKADKASK